jgi:chemotaxis protein CheD
MLKELRAHGASGEYVAWLVGGASMFRSLLNESGLNVGERNVESARSALASAGIGILGEDTGGELGRSVWYVVAEGKVRVRTVRGSEHVL